MSRVIQPSEVKRGDRIRITREIEVGGLHLNLINPSVYDSSHETLKWSLRDAKVELLSRPVELPTKPGSVIRLSEEVGDDELFDESEDSKLWFLRKVLVSKSAPYQPSRWVSEDGSQLRPEDLKRHITDKGLRLEVVL